jgi:hypothetical protein
MFEWVLVALLLVIWTLSKNTCAKERVRDPIAPLPVVDMTGAYDAVGINIPGTGGTPLTTPSRRACAHLYFGASMEGTPYNPGDV